MKRTNNYLKVILISISLIIVLTGCYSFPRMKRVDVTIIGEIGIRKPAKELTFNKPESKIRQENRDGI